MKPSITSASSFVQASSPSTAKTVPTADSGPMGPTACARFTSFRPHYLGVEPRDAIPDTTRLRLQAQLLHPPISAIPAREIRLRRTMPSGVNPPALFSNCLAGFCRHSGTLPSRLSL